MTDPADLYKVLQVDSEADPEVIQAAYRRLARKFHPDLAGDGGSNGGGGDGAGPERAERMIAINAAWEVLRDPHRRAEYDIERERARTASARSTDAGPAASAYAAGSGRVPGSATAFGGATPARRPSAGMPPPEPVSSNWTSGRSNVGGGYDEGSMRRPDGEGAAGPAPGKASGSLLNFGRYSGWSLGEIARRDLEYLEWLDRMTIGRPYRDEIDAILRRAGRRRSAPRDDRPGLFRRR